MDGLVMTRLGYSRPVSIPYVKTFDCIHNNRLGHTYQMYPKEKSSGDASLGGPRSFEMRPGETRDGSWRNILYAPKGLPGYSTYHILGLIVF